MCDCIYPNGCQVKLSFGTVLSGRTALKHGSAGSGLPQWLNKLGVRTVKQSYARGWTTVFVQVYQRGIPSSHSATLGGATPSFSLLVLDAWAKQSADKPASGQLLACGVTRLRLAPASCSSTRMLCCCLLLLLLLLLYLCCGTSLSSCAACSEHFSQLGSGLVFTCRCNLTPDSTLWLCWSDLEKFYLERF